MNPFAQQGTDHRPRAQRYVRSSRRIAFDLREGVKGQSRGQSGGISHMKRSETPLPKAICQGPGFGSRGGPCFRGRNSGMNGRVGNVRMAQSWWNLVSQSIRHLLIASGQGEIMTSIDRSRRTSLTGLEGHGWSSHPQLGSRAVHRKY